MEVIMGPDSEKWLGAMESEIESMHDNQVWNLVDPIDGETYRLSMGFQEKDRQG
jgi:hypothetical protein